MDGSMTKAQSKAGPGLLPLKRPAPLAGLPDFSAGVAAKLPNVGPAGGCFGGLGTLAPLGQGGLPGFPANLGGAAGFGAVAAAAAAATTAGALAAPLTSPTLGPPVAPPLLKPPGAPPAVGGPQGEQPLTLSLEVPSGKVGLVMGTGGNTIKAIKSISGASCVVQPNMPGADKTMLTLGGTSTQVERCRALIAALVGGDAVTVPPLGVAALPGGVPPALAGLARPPGLAPMPGAPGGPPGPIRAPGMGPGQLGPAAVPPPGLPPLASLAGGLAGGPLDVSKLGSLITALGNASTPAASSYYTQLLTAATQLVATQADPAGPEAESREKPQAFDRDALRRLAKQAKENPVQEEPVAITVPTNGQTEDAGLPVAVATDTTPSGAPEVGQSVVEEPLPPPVAPVAAVPPPPPPPPPQAEPPAPERSKKDSTSVLKFLQGAQDNVARARAGTPRGAPLASQPAIPSMGLASAAPASASTAGVPAGSSTATAVTGNPWEAICAKLQAVGSSSESRKAVGKDVLAALPRLEPTRAAELVIKVHAVEGLRSVELLDDLCKALAGVIPRFRSPDLTKLTSTFAVWALALNSVGAESRSRMSEAQRAFFNGVSAEVLLRLMDVAPGDLSRITAALVSVGVDGTRLFASVARAAVARADRFTPAELISLISAFDKAKCYLTALLEALARSLRVNIRDVPPKDVVQGMLSLAMCVVRDDALGQAVGEQLSKKGISSGGLSTEESCTLAWAFCVLDLHHDKMFRAVFRALEDAPVQASETLCQLYEIHLTLKAFHQDSYSGYELEDDTVRSLREHYKRHRGGGRSVKPERSSERLHNDVAELVREVLESSVSTGYVTSLGFAVDVAAMPRSRRSSSTSSSSSTPLVVLDVDGPHSLIRSLDPAEGVGLSAGSRVLGALGLKRRVLQKNGIRVGVFSEDEWRALDGDREKREFLRGVLRKAGVNEDKFR